MLKKINKDELSVIKNRFNQNIITLLCYYKHNQKELDDIQDIVLLLNQKEIFIFWCLMKKLKQVDILESLPFYIQDYINDNKDNFKDILISGGNF